MKFVDLILKAERWFWFFDEKKAKEKADELKRAGKGSKILKEKGNNWTVFQFKK